MASSEGTVKGKNPVPNIISLWPVSHKSYQSIQKIKPRKADMMIEVANTY